MLCMGKINKTKEWADYLSNKRQKFDVILMICACGFGLCLLLEVILYRLLSFGGTLAVRRPEGVERCLVFGGSKCTISTGRAIGGMEFVRCTEVICLLESPLLEVSLYMYMYMYIPNYAKVQLKHALKKTTLHNL